MVRSPRRRAIRELGAGNRLGVLDCGAGSIRFHGSDLGLQRVGVATLVGQGNKEPEISHAALISTGSCAGSVYFGARSFRLCTCSDVTSILWAVNPNSPAKPIAIYWDFASDVFCGGASWDKLGQLLIAGGVPPDCEGPNQLFPGETYRFRPKSLGVIITPSPWPVPPPPFFAGPSYFSFLRPPVVQQGDMVVGRYYPTVMPLQERMAEFSSTLLVNGTTTSGTTIEPGVNLVLGGPPRLKDGNGLPTGDGNEVWEVIETNTTDALEWEYPFIPEDPDDPDPDWGVPNPANPWHYNRRHHFKDPDLFLEPMGTGQTYDTYPRFPQSGYPDRLLDSYPRAFQLTNGEILICGDVPTSTTVTVGDPGAVWAIDPDYEGETQDGWDSTTGPIALTGQVGGGAWHDSFYDSAVLLQTIDVTGTRTYRVLMFGGSRYRPDPINEWVPNKEMWE